jgi:hypothetical protein
VEVSLKGVLFAEKQGGEIANLLVDCFLLVDDRGVDKLQFGSDLVCLPGVEGASDCAEDGFEPALEMGLQGLFIGAFGAGDLFEDEEDVLFEFLGVEVGVGGYLLGELLEER